MSCMPTERTSRRAPMVLETAEEGSMAELVSTSEYFDVNMELIRRREVEISIITKRDYLSIVHKNYISQHHRSEAVSFVIDIARTLGLQCPAIERAIRLFDIALASTACRRDSLQLMASACVSIAAKLDSDLSPAKTLVKLQDNAFTTDKLRLAEQVVLDHVHWEAAVPTAHRSMALVLGRAAVGLGLSLGQTYEIYTTASTLIMSALGQYAMSRIEPTTLAVAVVNCAAKLFDVEAASVLVSLRDRGVDLATADKCAAALFPALTRSARPTPQTTPKDARATMLMH
ncbi:Cyclin, N-terminal domain [Carpediemonas membranifera]|uniref:Cyclin, N-terminal domain n=1 Tax=Carpediemonas membranifera TaxID=201153 RepID=A0A8J6E5E9_9EUKA|nr:Cyclin, N-terminal domain [Carpediemonas membranifera]|eukprot:KAG9395662.1 Cyclin, N-terminal domain [Carpediemonas membranifera]